jgi:hypothetical protein
MANGNGWPNVETIGGTIHYGFMASYLDEVDGTTSLLLMDQPPGGAIVPQEIAAAASYFQHVLNKSNDDAIQVMGIRTQVSGQPAISIVRA